MFCNPYQKTNGIGRGRHSFISLHLLRLSGQFVQSHSCGFKARTGPLGEITNDRMGESNFFHQFCYQGEEDAEDDEERGLQVGQ